MDQFASQVKSYLHALQAKLPSESIGFEERYLGFEETPKGIKIKLASDGLTLDLKIIFEKEFLAFVANWPLDLLKPIGIHFVRTNSKPSDSKPESTKPKLNPFGKHAQIKLF